MEKRAHHLQARGRRFLLGPRTWLMGVINVTPDSFSDGGRYFEPSRAIERGLEMVAQGADILDIGGESTRPGSLPVPEEEELRRVVPVIESLRHRTEIPLSIDTTKSAVARAAIGAGADIVNDTSALRADPVMADTVARAGAGLILMHMKGTPLTMQQDPRYEDLLAEIKAFLAERIRAAEASGIARESLIVDPGIGFGKTFEDNLALLRDQAFLRDLDRPLLLGFSRKAFLGRILHLPPGERLEGTIAAAVLSVCRGAHILRVHDVAEVARAVRTAETILGGAAPEPGDVGRTGSRQEGHAR